MTPAGFATKSSPALAILSLSNRALTVLIHLQSSRADDRRCFLAPPLLFRNRLSYLLSFQSIRVPVTEDLTCSRTRHATMRSLGNHLNLNSRFHISQIWLVGATDCKLHSHQLFPDCPLSTRHRHRECSALPSTPMMGDPLQPEQHRRIVDVEMRIRSWTVHTNVDDSRRLVDADLRNLFCPAPRTKDSCARFFVVCSFLPPSWRANIFWTTSNLRLGRPPICRRQIRAGCPDLKHFQ